MIKATETQSRQHLSIGSVVRVYEKERNGRPVNYGKTTTKTKVESERNGIDLTNDLTIAYERGQYAQTDVFYDTRPDWIKNTDWADFTKTVGTSGAVVAGAAVIGSAVVATAVFGIPALMAAVGTATAVKMGSVAATAAGAYVVSQIVDNQDRGEK